MVPLPRNETNWKTKTTVTTIRSSLGQQRVSQKAEHGLKLAKSSLGSMLSSGETIKIGSTVGTITHQLPIIELIRTSASSGRDLEALYQSIHHGFQRNYFQWWRAWSIKRHDTWLHRARRDLELKFAVPTTMEFLKCFTSAHNQEQSRKMANSLFVARRFNQGNMREEQTHLIEGRPWRICATTACFPPSKQRRRCEITSEGSFNVLHTPP